MKIQNFPKTNIRKIANMRQKKSLGILGLEHKKHLQDSNYTMILLIHNQNKTLKNWSHYSLGELSLCSVNSTLIPQRLLFFPLQEICQKRVSCKIWTNFRCILIKSCPPFRMQIDNYANFSGHLKINFSYNLLLK